MPTILRVGPYQFHFYADEADEPPNIHATRDANEAKFWLGPVRLASAGGFAPHELRRIERIVKKHEQDFVEAWDAFFQP